MHRFASRKRAMSRYLRLVPFFVAGVLAIPSLAAQAVPAGQLSHWATILAILANGIKVAEVVFVMYGVYQYVAGREERRSAEQAAAALARKAANYQAWQVINSAQGKGGSGGRIHALHDLISSGVSLAGV